MFAMSYLPVMLTSIMFPSTYVNYPSNYLFPFGSGKGVPSPVHSGVDDSRGTWLGAVALLSCSGETGAIPTSARLDCDVITLCPVPSDGPAW